MTSEQQLLAVALASWKKIYSQAQRVGLLIAPIISGCLSVLGSSLILYMLYKRGSIKTRLPDRLLACSSLTDIVVSGWIIVGGLAVPKETGGPLAVGTWGTCEASGFFTNFSYTVGIYNVCLLLYSLFRVRYRWRESQIATRMEKYMHFVAISYPLSTGIYGLLMDAFNPLPMGLRRCFVCNYPPRCRLFEDCTRPKGNADITPLILNVIPTTSIIIIFFIILSLIYVTARKTYERSDNLRGSNMRAMANQSILYGFFFFTTYIWTILLTLATYVSHTISVANGQPPKPPPFGLVLCFEIFWPLQGFFNFVTFIRPRFSRIRLHRGDQSIFWAIRETIVGEALTSLRYHRRNIPSPSLKNSWERSRIEPPIISETNSKGASEIYEKQNSHQHTENNINKSSVSQNTHTMMNAERQAMPSVAAILTDNVFDGDDVIDSSDFFSDTSSIERGTMESQNRMIDVTSISATSESQHIETTPTSTSHESIQCMIDIPEGDRLSSSSDEIQNKDDTELGETTSRPTS